MNGAEFLMQTAKANGIDLCFANPGTTEMPLVRALDSTPGMRGVLGLFEGVCTGAADGYGRMRDRPALTLLHLGPGFANGMANLHNARRAGTPIINIIGEHATWHAQADAPLAMDIAAAVGTVSGWQRTITHADAVGTDLVAAFEAARQGQSATLIFPHDLQLATVSNGEVVATVQRARHIDQAAVEAAAAHLRRYPRTALILGGDALSQTGLMAAQRIRAVTQCDFFAESFAPRIERGPSLPDVPRVPYFPQQALSTLGQYDAFVLVSARRPVAFFGWPGAPSYFTRDDQPIVDLNASNQTGAASLDALAEALNAPAAQRVDVPARPTAVIGTGPLTARSVSATLAALQPENAIIANEGITVSQAYLELSAGAPAHTVLNLTGGAIGIGMPLATGAAVAAPDRPVINLQADGSAMYTLQALWTQARERLNVTTLLCSNRRYKILGFELQSAGVTTPGINAAALTSLADPAIGWAELARGLGVQSVTVETADQLAIALTDALSAPGPHLIEMRMAD